MMTPILGPGAKLRGYIRETANGKELLGPGGRLLGYYDEQKDQTLRIGGVFFGFGDQLLSLLED